MPITPQWVFSVSNAHLKLKNTVSNETLFFLKRSTLFYPVEGTDDFTLNGEGMNLIKKINRLECITPPPGANMEAFLDSLATLASL